MFKIKKSILEQLKTIVLTLACFVSFFAIVLTYSEIRASSFLVEIYTNAWESLQWNNQTSMKMCNVYGCSDVSEDVISARWHDNLYFSPWYDSFMLIIFSCIFTMSLYSLVLGGRKE